MNEAEEGNDVSVQLRHIAAYLIEVAERSHVADLPTHRSAIPLRQTIKADDLLALAWLAKEELSERRRRSTAFSPELFGEPAWDILLDLFVAKVGARKISVTSACIAADVPPTTALRWLTVLEGNGLICRQEDEFDQRRTWVTLSDEAFKKMTGYLRARSNSREPQIVGIGRRRMISDS
jgi:DNA-binding transcriptional ArsR family regulator